MLEPGTWEVAAITAERVVTTRLQQLDETYVLHDRVLPDSHFEFRGGASRNGRPSSSGDLDNRRDASADIVV
jgi:hypothetical protein